MGLLHLQQPSPQSHQQGLPHPQFHQSRPSPVITQQSQQQQQQQHHHQQVQSQQQQQQTQQQQSYHHQSAPGIHAQHQASYGTASQTHSPASSTADNLAYYSPSPYSAQSSTGGYPSTESSDMMASAHVPRHPYPPIYHTPQSNSPASVASPSHPEHQHRGIYTQPAQPMQHHQSMYYQSQQYPPISAHAPSYAQHGQHPQHPQHAQHSQHPQSHQSMSPQPNMMMSHSQPSHVPTSHMAQSHISQGQLPPTQMQQQSPLTHSTPQMGTPQMPQHPQHSQPPQHPQHHQQHHAQHQPQHHQQPPHHQVSQQQQQQAQSATDSPRHHMQPKMEPAPLQISSKTPISTQSPHAPSSATPLSTPTTASHTAQINPSAAPGPIPATTPLVVRQDDNGVQWIAFEYSRDRVKMEYTIRCDVESVNTDQLQPEFKQENCVYPRACCPKEEYRGNRLAYETECNQVGWALAELNPSLQGKRGLIQRAVDSWRNSNRDPKLRSRRVRRQAKMTQRRTQGSHSPLVGPGGPNSAGMPAMSVGVAGQMGPGGTAPPMTKAGLGVMGQPMHHHQSGHGEEVDSDYDEHTHHHQAPQAGTGAGDGRSGRGVQSGYEAGANGTGYSNGALVTRPRNPVDNSPSDLFPDMPTAKKRKFILVEDNARGSRLRVRVTLETVNTREIPDSFRKGSSVFPRSYFPREMQNPPPSPTGTRFFAELDRVDGEEDGRPEDGGRGGRGRGRSSMVVRVSIGDDGKEIEVTVPRMKASQRSKEIRLNELGYRMSWLQSRVFAGRTIFLQRALDCYRNKTKGAIENMMADIKVLAPHYETRIGKRRWNERMRRRRGDSRSDD